MTVRKATKNDIREIAKLMIEEFSKPPFNEKTTINSVIKSLNFYCKPITQKLSMHEEK